jgi:predicted nucleic acid-binding protein
VKQSATLDSSFWINAHRCGLLEFALKQFTLYYAPAVAGEMSEEFASGREFWRLAREGVLAEVAPKMDRVRAFGPGERGAMNLALEHPDWLLLIDDRRPLQGAQQLGIRTVCTPVLIVDLYHRGLFDLRGAFRTLARLSAMQTVSPILIEAAVVQLGIEQNRKAE